MKSPFLLLRNHALGHEQASGKMTRRVQKVLIMDTSEQIQREKHDKRENMEG